jgi:hypothetical protein
MEKKYLKKNITVVTKPLPEHPDKLGAALLDNDRATCCGAERVEHRVDSCVTASVPRSVPLLICKYSTRVRKQKNEIQFYTAAKKNRLPPQQTSSPIQRSIAGGSADASPPAMVTM